MLTAGAVHLRISFEDVHQLTRSIAAAYPDKYLRNIGGLDLIHRQGTHDQLKIRLATVSQIILSAFFVDPFLRIERAESALCGFRAG
jgi:hypothetical protein